MYTHTLVFKRIENVQYSVDVHIVYAMEIELLTMGT